MVDPKFIAQVVDQLWERLRPKLQETNGKYSVWPRLLTVEEAGIYARRSEAAMRQLIFKGELVVVRRGRNVRIDRADLDRWIDANKV